MSLKSVVSQVRFPNLCESTSIVSHESTVLVESGRELSGKSPFMCLLHIINQIQSSKRQQPKSNQDAICNLPLLLCTDSR